jgi:MFS family permease
MLTQKHMTNSPATRASILMKTGACVGGTIIGYISQWFGRRRTIIVSALMVNAASPHLVFLCSSLSKVLGVSFHHRRTDACKYSCFLGVIPIHLNELSPPAFRSSFPGLTYQLGNMISSPSAQIVNAIAESNLIKSSQGKLVSAYGPTMGIATAIIALGIVFTTALGSEKRGRKFETVGPPVVTVSKDLEQGESDTLEKKEGARAVEHSEKV